MEHLDTKLIMKEQIDERLRRLHSEPKGRHELMVAAMAFGSGRAVQQSVDCEPTVPAVPPVTPEPGFNDLSHVQIKNFGPRESIRTSHEV